METPKWHYQQAKGVLEKSGVGCMIPSPIKAQFDSVLNRQHLADVASSFSDPNYFDEVPLYSRYEQVEFLKQYGDVNVLLVELALDYLDRVTSEIHLTGPERFVAITVISDDDDEYIVPSIFACNSSVKSRLRKLYLSPPLHGLGERIKTLVKKAKRDTTYSILEDRCTVPDDVRVFISYKKPPRGLVSLKTFANDASG